MLLLIVNILYKCNWKDIIKLSTLYDVLFILSPKAEAEAGLNQSSGRDSCTVVKYWFKVYKVCTTMTLLSDLDVKATDLKNIGRFWIGCFLSDWQGTFREAILYTDRSCLIFCLFV